MQITRRMLLRNSLALAAVSVVPVTVTGCNGNDSVQILNTVIQAASGVLAVAEPGAPWLANFNQAVLALETAEQQWQGGSPVQIVISALNTLAAVTPAIPLTAAYAPLVAILVAGIDAVLTALNPPSGTAPVTAPRAKAAAKFNPYYGLVPLRKPRTTLGVYHQTYVSAFKEQWNDAVNANPALEKARLK